MATEVFIPKFGQTVEQVELVNWLVPDGTKVNQGQEILEVETDKAIFSVESSAKGWLHIGPYKEGDTVPVLTVVAYIGKEDENFSALDAKPEMVIENTEEEIGTSQPSKQTVITADKDTTEKFASPRARKLAMNRHVDLTQVTPTGGKGVRVIERDVIAYLAQAPQVTTVEGLDLHSMSGTGPDEKITKDDVVSTMQPEVPSLQVTPSSALPMADVVERIPLKNVRALIAERMAISVHTSARVTLMMEIDATEFVRMRERLKASVADLWGFAPGYIDILTIFVSRALREYPYMNARLVPGAIEILGHVNIGLAVDTERGLLVPVIRDADQKSLRQLGAESRTLAEHARTGRSLPDDLTGGTFTITNLGMYDIGAFTPVINLPEAAILGVGRITPKPVAHGESVVVRQMWTLSLVFDHRLVDGAPAARFLQYIKQMIEEPS